MQCVIPAKALHRMVYRAKAGIQIFATFWTPAFAGVTIGGNKRTFLAKRYMKIPSLGDPKGKGCSRGESRKGRYMTPKNSVKSGRF